MQTFVCPRCEIALDAETQMELRSLSDSTLAHDPIFCGQCGGVSPVADVFMHNKSSEALPAGRTGPASPRTKLLPDVASCRQLLDWLLANFGDKDRLQLWITGEELCDVVERYADWLHVTWHQAACGISRNMTYVSLVNTNLKDGFTLYGLFPFESESEARKFCYDPVENPKSMFGQLESAWGIRGRYALNFSTMGYKYNNNWWIDPLKTVAPQKLWERICRRRVELGVT